MSDAKTTSTSGGIGVAGLLTIVFVILKLNPGGHLTTAVAEWPWIGWGVSVLCPIVFCFYIFFGIVGLVLGIMAAIFVAKMVLEGAEKVRDNTRRKQDQKNQKARASRSGFSSASLGAQLLDEIFDEHERDKQRRS